MSAQAGDTDRCRGCGRPGPWAARVLGQPICVPCHRNFRYRTQPCPHCQQPRVLAFADPDGQPACARCTGADPTYACLRCGREDNFWAALCARCTLQDKLADLLADPNGAIHPDLLPVHDALVNSRRPRSALTWLNRSSGPDLLAAMAAGTMPISHHALAELPPSKTVNYLRDLLTALDVLPPYHAELHRLLPWLDDRVAEHRAPHADALARYIRWHVLRRLRHHENAATLTHGRIGAARSSIIAASRYLHWLRDNALILSEASQSDLDTYLHSHPARRDALIPFTTWAAGARLSTGARPPPRPSTEPVVTISDEQRWAHVEELLHDDSIRLYSRLAGLFTLLFAQPLARIVRLRTEQITVAPDRLITIAFDRAPIELPEPVDRLVRAQLARPGQASYASSTSQWLFPGGIPGNHLVTENIRSQLRARGIQPSSARKAALFSLAAQIPVPVLADLVGISTTTATRWAALSARDWATYTALRRAQQQ